MKISTVLKLSGSTLAAALLAGPVFAQETGPGADNEIIVTGTRASLQDALDYKRRSDSIVDVITAEDIGELPDNNVAESLQRITGVQIEREQGAGARIRVRGLSANTLVNGRVLVGATDRQFNFRNLASDFFQTLEVSKSIRADQIEGALGGVVNLVTRKPTDLKERLLSTSLLGSYGERAEGAGLTGSLTYADKFADGRIGFIVALSYDRSKTREDNFMARGGFTPFDVGTDTGFNFDADPATNEALKPVDLRFLTEEQSLERTGINAALNWEAADNLDIRVDGLFLRLDNDWRRFFFRTLFDRTFVPGSLEISDVGVITAGTFTNQRVQPDGRNYPERTQTYQGGVNFDWRPGNFTVNADINYSRSERRRIEQFLRYQGFQNATVRYDLNSGNTLPDVILTTASGQPYDLHDPSGFFTELHFDRLFDGYQKKWEAKLDVALAVEKGPLQNLKAGVRISLTDAKDALYQSLPQSPAAGNPAFFENGQRRPITSAPISQFLGSPHSHLFAGFGGNIPRGWVAGNITDVGINDFSERFSNDLNLNPRELLADSFQNISENTYAAYGMADFGGDVFGISFAANIGARWVRTKLRSTGIVATPTYAFLTIENEYDDVLPAANIKFDLADNLIFRLAGAKSVERAPLNKLIAGFNLDRSSGSASGGNPLLDPFRANQFDASLEFYRSRDGAYSATFFYKDVKNFITTATETGEIPGFTLLDGSTEFLITRPVNGGPARIKGFELSAQEALTFLPGFLGGLGVVANYTYTDIKTATAEPFPDLSKHAYNLIGYYNRGPLDIRAAYSWRSRFASSAEGGNAAQGLGLYEYTAAQGFLDASVSYDISEAVRIRFEMFNITNTMQRRYLEKPENLRNLLVHERRFVVGARFAF
ncbi:TonB-dependent receptor [Sphingopyxis kveilinensis]|uniref:TonB-dependent receptor n=1 Tax=Sphingopyxis kveilinensis TaxID=3114367 RepID=UPI0030D5D443